MRSGKSDKKGFTFIELMIAVLLMAMCFFPMMELFTTALTQITISSEMSSSLNLAREGMEMVRNMNLPAANLEKYGSIYYPPLNSPPIVLNNKEWRIYTVFYKGTRPLQVEVKVLEEPWKKETISLTTLFEDLY